MRINLKLLFAGVFWMSAAIPALAQATKRQAVAVSCSCEDTMGKAYLSALRELLAKNTSYREVSESEGVGSRTIQISIVSMPIAADDGESTRSALSIVCLHDGTILHQMIETCAHIPLRNCAQSMLDDLKAWTAP